MKMSSRSSSDHLETIGAGTSEHQSRALLLFALVMVEILQKSFFGVDVDDLEFLESVILDSLAIAAGRPNRLNSEMPVIGSSRSRATNSVRSWRITRSVRWGRVAIRARPFRAFRVARTARPVPSTSCTPPKRTL